MVDYQKHFHQTPYAYASCLSPSSSHQNSAQTTPPIAQASLLSIHINVPLSWPALALHIASFTYSNFPLTPLSRKPHCHLVDKMEPMSSLHPQILMDVKCLSHHRIAPTKRSHGIQNQESRMTFPSDQWPEGFLLCCLFSHTAPFTPVPGKLFLTLQHSINIASQGLP
jgi:hypothetical protein